VPTRVEIPTVLQKKICLLGAFAVGKTSLVRRFVESLFSDVYLTTVGVKIDKKVVRVGKREVMLTLWDLAGNDNFQQMRQSYLNGAAGLLLVADGTRRATLREVVTIQKEATRASGCAEFVLALNKHDLSEEWETTSDDEDEIVARGWKVVHTSAKTGQGVDLAFETLASTMLHVGREGSGRHA
jgi:small GTP-binding protein